MGGSQVVRQTNSFQLYLSLSFLLVLSSVLILDCAANAQQNPPALPNGTFQNGGSIITFNSDGTASVSGMDRHGDSDGTYSNPKNLGNGNYSMTQVKWGITFTLYFSLWPPYIENPGQATWLTAYLQWGRNSTSTGRFDKVTKPAPSSDSYDNAMDQLLSDQ